MVVRTIVAATVIAVVVITVWRGVRAADWQLMRQLPGQEWAQRGPMIDHQQACMTALASEGIVVPSGTKLKCQRANRAREANR
jgi:hypothetical protein